MTKHVRCALFVAAASITVPACGSSPPTAPTTTSPAPISAAPASPSTPTGPAAPSGSSAFEDEVLVLTNRRRSEGATCGGTRYPAVAPLTLDLRLREAARGHSEDMARNNYFSHVAPDGSTPDTRALRSGYTGGSVVENIVGGQSSPQAAVDAWMQSSGHCANIMNSRYRVIGVGYAFSAASLYRHYSTQVFGGG